MSEQGRSSSPVRRPARALSINWELFFLALLLAVGAAFYLQSLNRFFMYDDEGGYAYAAWRISLGEVPYRDFLTPQMPGFLYWGSLIVRLFGRSFLALRIPSLLAMLGAATLLFAVNRRLFGRAVALGAVGLFLITTNIFHNARFYRPEAYMLLFNLAGVYCLVLSEERQRLWWLSLAGVFFGLSVTFKLFGFLSLAGGFLYLVYAWWRERRPFGKVLRQGLALGLPPLLIVGAVALFFYRLTPYFFTAVFEHHTMQGAGMGLLGRLAKGLRFFREYAWYQPVLVLLIGWGAFSLRRGRTLSALWLCQLPTALSFFALTRSLMTRHLTYLEPALATLIALALVGLVQGRWRLWRLRAQWHYQLLALALALLALWPGAKLTAVDSNQTDIEPLKLAELIQELTTPEQAVVADFPGINFAAGRRSTYWAAGISGGAAESGQIRGAMLNEEIEREQVAMVIINTRYGAHQMIEMLDYPDFRRYVQAHFSLIDKYHCGYQQLEIYCRTDAMPLQPNIPFQDQIALTGVRLGSTELRPGSTVALDTRWQALAPMPYDYHASLRLVDATGHIWAQVDEPLMEEFSHREPGIYWDVTDRFRASRWEPQQVVLQEHELPVGTEVPSGSYYLTAKVYDLESGYALLAPGGEGMALPNGDTVIATVRVTSTPGALRAEALPLTRPLDAAPAGGVELVGVAAAPGQVRAGRDLPLSLIWRAAARPSDDYRLEFRLQQGQVVRQRWTAEPVEGFPTGSWQAGELLLGHYVLPLEDELPAGRYALALVAVDSRGRPAGDEVTLGEVTVEERPDPARLKEAIENRLEGITLGEQIALLGYDLAADTVAPGETVGLTLYWECLQTPAKEYKVFTHLLDGAGQIQGQRDSIPDNGAAPTSGWMVGDVLADRYEIPVQATATGELQIAIGLYDPLLGDRLPLYREGQATGQDHFVLPAAVTVR